MIMITISAIEVYIALYEELLTAMRLKKISLTVDVAKHPNVLELALCHEVPQVSVSRIEALE